MDDIEVDMSYEDLMIMLHQRFGVELIPPEASAFSVIKVDDKPSKFLGMIE